MMKALWTTMIFCVCVFSALTISGCGSSDDDIIDTVTNTAPVAKDLTATTKHDQALTITLSATDAEGNELIYTIVSNPSHGKITLNGLTATYTPDAGYVGLDSFTYKVSDGTGESNTATVTLKIVTPWAKRAGGSENDKGYAISVLPDGSSLVTGGFQDTAILGEGETNATSLTSAGGYDIFIAKYNADGTLAWAKSAGGSGHDIGYGISVLSDGSSLVTGYFEGMPTFGGGETNATILTSAGSADIFIAKYNADGTLTWAKRIGGSKYDTGSGISVLPDGSSLVTGYFADTATFGKGDATETILTSAGNKDIFIAKYNADLG